jgi:hypothetical protein
MLDQLIWLVVLTIPTACVAWAVTHEEIFREPRERLTRCSENSAHWWQRKLCYMFTCEYCFSHYVAAAMVALTDYRLLLLDWRGYLIAWLGIVAVANVYMSGYSRLRVDIHKERAETKESEKRARKAG